MTSKRFLFLVSGKYIPSTRFRMLPYVAALRQLGYRCDVAYSFPDKYAYLQCLGWRLSQKLKRATRKWHLLRAKFTNYDAIIIERELFDNTNCDIEKQFRNLPTRIVLDVDDGVFLRYPDKFKELIPLVDHVIVGSHTIADAVRDSAKGLSVIPTVVDLAQYPFRLLEPEDVVIGWIGTESNVPYLNQLAAALLKLKASHKFRLRIVTANRNAVETLKLGNVPIEFVQWTAKTAVEELWKFTIGIMPLPDEPWERYKCGCKLIQYMACGVPAVASPVGANMDIVQHGHNGLLATTDENWFDALVELLDDETLRRKLAYAGRDTIEAKFALDKQVSAFLAALIG